jgi:uncharacterized membrane protein YhiD involved in acid resistance|nr:DUF4956 domain-containing protein [uncultured Acetatifactor sp.]
MSIQDVIKKSFLKGFQNTNLLIRDVAILMVMAAVLGIYIYFIYRIVTANTFYSKSFNTSLILMSVITAAIIIAIQSSVIVSLGMVGALSIVRFRTAVKEPLDLIFMFWSISIGIICGAGMVGLAFVLSLMATILVLVFYRLPESRKSMILVINAQSNACADKIYDTVRAHDKNYNVKSRNLTKESADFLMEIKSKNCESLLNDLNSIEGVISVSMVTHKGDAAF